MTDHDAATARVRLDLFASLTARATKLQEFLDGVNTNADIWIHIDPTQAELPRTDPRDRCVTLFARNENGRDCVGGLDKSKMLVFAKQLATQELFRVRDEIAAL
jgi:hypothetical protein